MASRAAVGRQGFPDAANYLTKLLSNLLADTNSPPELSTRARLAYGDVLMLLDSTDTNQPLANIQTATDEFARVVQTNPTNEFGLFAWRELAKCQLQLLNYAAATNAFAQVFNSPYADVAARSEAKIGFGLALEKIAATLTDTNQVAALQLARDSYLDVFYTWTGKNLRDGEVADSVWVKKAGLQALPLVQKLGTDNLTNFIGTMETLFPQAKDSLEKKKAALNAVKN
jgi:hypothetical protein